MKKFNERLRELREDSNLTQKNLAKELMIDQRSLSFYEIGKYEPNLDTLSKIVLFFNVSADYLLGLTDNKIPYPRENSIK
ncbi:MAG: helix-turn-helix transcriptional regulator [Clostridia bacterium]|jgi:transcriptional regulator with XRE-family HTH domain|nr:helix-turn-helix transcriptional regulator [Clostridia bacterium]